MPTVVRDRGISFVIHTRELPFEPPHVHVVFGDDEIRIELLGGTFMEEPPAGKRRLLLDLYHEHVERIWQAWEDLHGGRAEEG